MDFAGLATNGLRHSRNSPCLLEAFANTYSWAFGAIADLVDNAYDSNTQATFLDIRGENRAGQPMLILQDNGRGMTWTTLDDMMGFGYSSKRSMTDTIGQYGVGFKAGCMALGRNVVVFTQEASTASVALLSLDFLHAIKANEIVVPRVTYKVAENKSYEMLLPASPTEWKANLDAITTFSPGFPTEAALFTHLESLQGRGTCIMIFGLHKNMCLDFKSDPSTIILKDSGFEKGASGDNEDAGKRAKFFQRVPAARRVKIDYDLRCFLSILYLRPRINIILQGKPVDCYDPRDRFTVYRSSVKGPYLPQIKGLDKNTGVTASFGFDPENKQDFGIHLYYRGRLIRPFEKMGEMLAKNCMMNQVLGVAEVDCCKVQPNKLDFVQDMVYLRVTAKVGEWLKQYYYEEQAYRTAGIGVKQRDKLLKKFSNSTQPKAKVRRVEASLSDTDEEVDEDSIDEQRATSSRPKRACVARTWQEHAESFINKALAHDKSWPFRKPFNPSDWVGAEDYFDIIKTPMDLGTIKQKLKEAMYATFFEMFQDVDLVFRNCMSYNAPTSEFYHMAYEMQEWSQQQVHKLRDRAAAYGLSPDDFEADFGDEAAVPEVADPAQLGEESEPEAASDMGASVGGEGIDARMPDVVAHVQVDGGQGGNNALQAALAAALSVLKQEEIQQQYVKQEQEVTVVAPICELLDLTGDDDDEDEAGPGGNSQTPEASQAQQPIPLPTFNLPQIKMEPGADAGGASTSAPFRLQQLEAELHRCKDELCSERAQNQLLTHKLRELSQKMDADKRHEEQMRAGWQAQEQQLMQENDALKDKVLVLTANLELKKQELTDTYKKLQQVESQYHTLEQRSEATVMFFKTELSKKCRPS